MIPLATIFILKKLGFIVDLNALKSNFKQFITNLKSIFWIIPLCMLIFSVNDISKPEKVENLTFEIYRNSKSIGLINIEKQVFADRIRFEISSHIDTRFLFKIEAEGKETSEFVDGILTYSSVYRELNNRVKSNHTVVLENEIYKMKSEGGVEDLKFRKIRQNLVCLYFNQPKPLQDVYCDNEGAIAKIQQLSPSTFKVEIGSGKYNIFHYKNGKCFQIESHNALYNVTLIARS